MFRSILILALLASTALTGAHAQQQAPRHGDRAAGDVDGRARALDRWRALDPAQRDELRRRFESWRALPPAERDALQRGARGLDEMRQRLLRTMSAETRARLDALPAAQRQVVLSEMLAEEARQFAQRLLGRLPSDVRAKIEAATPAERARFLAEFQRQQEQSIDRGWGRGRPEFGPPPPDFDGLDRDAKRRAFFTRVRAKLIERVDASGLPDGMTPAEWERIKVLTDEDFFAAFQRLRELHPDFAPFAARGFGPREDGMGPPPPRDGFPAPDPRFGPGEGRHGRGGRPPHEPTGERSTWEERRRIGAALRIEPDAYIDLAAWSPDARASRLAADQRDRVLAVLESGSAREGGLVTKERLAELKVLEVEAFLREARGLVSCHSWAGGPRRSDGHGGRSGRGPDRRRD